MRFETAFLEDWMRRYYLAADVDIGSSGVSDLAFGELRELIGISAAELDAVVLRDSTSFGSAGVRDAVAARWGNGDPDRVMVTHGASEALYLVLSTLLEPGDEIVALEPSYHSHTSIAGSLGCTVRPWRLSADRGFRPDLDELRASVGKHTRAIVVNFPHNPTGAVLSPTELAELVSAAADAGAYLVWDAAFAELVYEGEPLPDPTWSYERAISIGTLSKAYGLPGLRFGWCIAAPAVLGRLVDLRDRMTLHLSPLVELVAERVARHAERILERQLAVVRRNLAEVTAWAADHADLVDFVPPGGGATAFPRLLDHADTEPLCRELAHAERVLLVPGSCFGAPDRVRLGFGGPTESLRTGLRVLAAALEPAAARKAPAPVHV